jgi:hypothetical protein
MDVAIDVEVLCGGRDAAFIVVIQALQDMGLKDVGFSI